MQILTDLRSGEQAHLEPAAAEFRSPLPRELRADAESLGWNDFCDLYAGAHHVGMRLERWTARPARADLVDYQATIAAPDRTITLQETATGPIAAATAMLYSIGCGVEVTGLHQQTLSCGVTVLVCVERDTHRAWGLGMDATAGKACATALFAAAGRVT